MPYTTQVGVIGTAIHAPIKQANQSLEEIIYAVTQQALADAGLSIEELDGIVVAANDQIDGRAISVMAASGSVGGVDHDILSTPSASEHAFVLGALRVASGLYRNQLIVSWSPTEAGSIPDVQRLANDPYYHRALPLDELSAGALQASALESVFPASRDLALEIVTKNRRHGARAYSSATRLKRQAKDIAASRVTHWPLREAMVAPPVTGAVALVLAAPEWIRDKRPASVAWLRGMGWATEASFLGDRNLASAPALVAARTRAYEEAQIADPLTAVSVAEVSDSTPHQELMAYEALGFCQRDECGALLKAGDFAAGGILPVNPSGGALWINPVFCTGLIRITEAANQVRGRAERHQVSEARTALAHAASGFAMQYQTVVVLGNEPGRVG